MSVTSVKGVILHLLTKVIYEPLEAASQKELEAIATEHSNAKNQTVCYFDYKGERYQLTIVKGQRCLMSTLLPALQPRMNAWLKNKKDVLDTEKVYILGLFRKVLNSSESIRDYKRLLPECTHSVLDQCRAEFFDLPPALSDEFVKQFWIDNESAIVQLKTRMMYNILT